MPVRAWHFVTLRWRSRLLAKELRRDAKSVLRRQWRKQGGSRRDLILNYQLAKERIDDGWLVEAAASVTGTGAAGTLLAGRGDGGSMP